MDSGPTAFNLDDIRQSLDHLENFKSGQMTKIRNDQVSFRLFSNSWE